MSKRLDSINRSSSISTTSPLPTGKPSLKFKPKVVSRKSKEERENASTTINKPGVNKLAEKNNRRLAKKPTPGGAGKNNRLNGTQLVMSGPLSEGTISLGGTAGAGSSRGNGASNPLLEKLKSQSLSKPKKTKVKLEDGSYSGYTGEDSDSDLDDNAINMSQSFNRNTEEDMDLDAIDTDLFPIRAERIEHHEYGVDPKEDKSIKTEFHKASSVITSEPTTRENTIDPQSNTPTSRSATPFEDATENSYGEDDENLNINDYQEQQEKRLLEEDYKSLANSLQNLNFTESSNINNNLFFFQLPCSLPVFEGGLDGSIGKIRIHKSGKVSMKIGNVKFELTRGGSSEFIQDVVLVDPENGNCYHVGNIQEKITGIPQFI